MKTLHIILYSILTLYVVNFGACSAKKKPVGNFQSVECRTICNNGSCTQQCVGASGDYYEK